MFHSTNTEELQQMKANIRRSLRALEVCWSCQSVGECAVCALHDGPPVWLCCACRRDILDRRPACA